MNEHGHIYKGTFVESKLDGYCHFTDPKNEWTRIGEVDNERWVKATSYL